MYKEAAFFKNKLKQKTISELNMGCHDLHFGHRWKSLNDCENAIFKNSHRPIFIR